ncbi:hypothetical protein Ahy_A03g015232 [Arachis hypogaea]|uniref:Uncharacterized protein n=1 Tax=Arachis hypogaea TaxID=3818 RepID=A0A445E097_ARAHY|nr:hypothetical protein Ahy_A03g015232 [Arachis hypogaea]
MLKQHRQLSMSVQRTTENNEKVEIRTSKTYQSFVAAVGGHHELSFIEKDMKNYIIREVQNISELEDAKKFGKYLLRMKEKNHNFFFTLELEAPCVVWRCYFIRYHLNTNSLSRSPLLGRDEKHTKEREYACFFLTSLLQATAHLSNLSNTVWGSWPSRPSPSYLSGCSAVARKVESAIQQMVMYGLHNFVPLKGFRKAEKIKNSCMRGRCLHRVGFPDDDVVRIVTARLDIIVGYANVELLRNHK